MTDTSKCLRAYAVGDEDVTNGSVENYDFDWGDPVAPPDDRCGECPDNCNRCSCGCQNRCGCCNSCGCQNRCNCCNPCGCETVPEPGPEPEPDPDPVETPPICPCDRCRKTAEGYGAYPIVDL